MSEQQDADRIRLSFGETVKFKSGSFKKYDVEYITFRKPNESMKDCFVRGKKVLDGMGKIMALKTNKGEEYVTGGY